MPISRAHTELTAVGELRRGVVQHDRAVDARQEALGGGGIGRDDGLGMRRTVTRDMSDRSIHAIDHPRRDHGVEILGPPVLLGGRPHPRIDG